VNDATKVSVSRRPRARCRGLSAPRVCHTHQIQSPTPSAPSRKIRPANNSGCSFTLRRFYVTRSLSCLREQCVSPWPEQHYYRFHRTRAYSNTLPSATNEQSALSNNLCCASSQWSCRLSRRTSDLIVIPFHYGGSSLKRGQEN